MLFRRCQPNYLTPGWQHANKKIRIHLYDQKAAATALDRAVHD